MQTTYKDEEDHEALTNKNNPPNEQETTAEKDTSTFFYLNIILFESNFSAAPHQDFPSLSSPQYYLQEKWKKEESRPKRE